VTALDSRFAGNVPALVTPCHADGSPDLPAMRRLVEHVVTAGVGAINILGTTGEFSLVPPAERAPIIRAAVAAAKGRVAVMVGCGRPSLAETATEIEIAAECGALAALVTPSYYFSLSDPEIVRFFSRLGEAAPLPLLYYHYPQMTGCPASASAILSLARAGIVAGVKDSSGDAAFFARLAAGSAELGDFRLFVGGSGFLLGALALGASGVIGALSGFAPSLDHALIDAFGNGDMARARRAQASITRAVDSLFGGTPRNPAAVAKAILAAFDLCGDTVFPPLEPLSQAERRRLLDQLPSLGIAMPSRAKVDVETINHSP
jgi:4-hydroxy-tetrahydrodipicolinate synthase